MTSANKSKVMLRHWIWTLLFLVCVHFVDGEVLVGDKREDTFDFIVVGGGTGGCAIAGRLAENGKNKVLLIEMGGTPEPDQEIPALQAQLFGNPRTTRHMMTVPQINAGLENNGTVRMTVGLGLGGGSAVNGMFFNRGNPHDYNLWARLARDDSWNYTNILPYLKMIEAYSGDYPTNEHGYDGPISVSSPQYAPGRAEWLEAGKELGFPNVDPNGPQKLSFTSIEFAKDFGRRVSSYTGYIKPILDNSAHNLTIRIHTEVLKIIFDGVRAVGVQYRTNSSSGEETIGYANATKEIIVSAGVIGTPILLQKSGVGPRAVLEPAGIPIVRNLPVGKYIHEHVGIPIPVILANKSVVFDPNTDLNDEASLIYNHYGDGPYSSTLGASGQAFLPSSAIPPSEKRRDWADIHLVALNIPSIGPPRPSDELNQGETFASWSANVARPRARGSVSINPKNINGPPLLDLNLLDNPTDMQVAVDAMKWVVRICEETSSFKRLGCRMPKKLPACRQFKFKSNKYWRCYVRTLGRSGFHPVGSCQMGRGWENLQATVDTKLKVIGTEGLRIVDASVMPATVNSHTMVAVYAIAEKAADMILNDMITAQRISPRSRYLTRIQIPKNSVVLQPNSKSK